MHGRLSVFDAANRIFWGWYNTQSTNDNTFTYTNDILLRYLNILLFKI